MQFLWYFKYSSFFNNFCHPELCAFFSYQFMKEKMLGASSMVLIWKATQELSCAADADLDYLTPMSQIRPSITTVEMKGQFLSHSLWYESEIIIWKGEWWWLRKSSRKLGRKRSPLQNWALVDPHVLTHPFWSSLSNMKSPPSATTGASTFVAKQKGEKKK